VIDLGQVWIFLLLMLRKDFTRLAIIVFDWDNSRLSEKILFYTPAVKLPPKNHFWKVESIVLIADKYEKLQKKL